MQPQIETERLLIREILPTDEEGMFEMDSDREVQWYVGGKPLTEIQQSRDVITFLRQQYAENGIARWAIIKKDDGAFAGWVG